MLDRLKLRLSLLALFTLFGCSTPSKAPNIILILTDDQGYGDVGFHRNPNIRTPNLDRLAAESVEMTRFYVSPVCAPTRAALMTGRYHYRSGVVHTSRGGAKMHGDETTIAEMLRPAGYRTGLFGKWHLGDNYPMRPIDQGFDEALWHKSGGIGQSPDRPNDYFDPQLWLNDQTTQGKGYCTDIFFQAAIDFIERNRENPFFIYLPTNAPHTPLIVAEEAVQPYLDAGLDETTARVYAMVENIDDNLGRLTERLDELNLTENTLLVFITDNGPQQKRYTAGLRGQKTSVYEGGIRAVNLWRWPQRLTPRKIESPAAHIDVAPTLLDVADIEAPPDRPFDGVSLLPLVEGRDDAVVERLLFFQVHRGLTPQPHQNVAVVSSGWKLVAGPGTFGDESWAGSDAPPLELYDLAADPGEQTNVISEHPEELQRLRAAYEEWFESVRGTRNFTPGVIVIDPDHEDPTKLCRYQDSSYVNGRPTTWSVEIARAGQYEVSVDRAGDQTAAVLWVDMDGERSSQPLEAGQDAALVELRAGSAKLDIWVQQADGERVLALDNSTLGDVTLRWKGPGAP